MPPAREGRGAMSGNQMAEEEVLRHIDDDVMRDAGEANVDAGSVILEMIEEKGDRYQPKVVGRLAESRIRSRIEAAETESLTGIVMGSRDRAGKNWPRRYSLVRSDGDHLEVSAWSGRLDSTEGGEARIPVEGGVAEIRAEYDGEHDSWEAQAIGETSQLPGDELRKRLLSVAENPSEITPRDEYTTVVVVGHVSYVSPQTVFEDGNKQGPGPVLMEDERGDMRPHAEFTLATDDDTVVRAHLERQRYGEPYVDLTDSDALFSDAAANGPPEEQCGLLRDVYISERVVVVGNISSYDRYTNDDGETKFYADIQASAIIDVPEETDSGGEVAGSQDDSKASENAESAESNAESIRSDIETYCDLTGESPETLTADEVREKISTVPDETPDSVIRHALDADADGGSDDGGADESEPEETADPLERLENPDGTFACPAESCLFSGSEASLYGHAMSKHISGDTDPKEWVIANA